MSRTIGVLGGMGPYATVDFVRLMLDVTPVARESDHIRVVADSNPRIPSRTRAYLFGEADPVPEMKEGVSSLISAGADFIVVPCNSAHYFLPRVFEGLRTPYIDMIESTSVALERQGWKRVGVLAGEVTVGAGLYEAALVPRNIEVVQVDGDDQKLVRNVIEDVKSNSIDSATHTTIQQLARILRNKGAEAAVLGCTELQAVIRGTSFDMPYVDSTEELARAAIQRAMAPQQEPTKG